MNEHAFQQQLILAAITKGACTLQDIAHSCGGLYPHELRASLEELVFDKKVVLSPQGYQPVIRGKTSSSIIQLRKSGDYDFELPEPHPHDYDWRFDTATAQRLATLTIQESVPDGKILLLGTPSVFIELLYAHKAPHTTLLDWSSALLDYISHFHLPNTFTLVEHDLLSGPLWRGNSQVDIVLCDPPWYVEHYAAFLAQAAWVTQIGARILVSLLPPNTRPGAITDRGEIFNIAHRLGLHILSMESGSIRYETPAFEHASLHSASIDIQKNWRVGDLVTFGKIDHPSRETIKEILSSATSMGVSTQKWAEVLVGRYKVKLRGPFDDYVDEPELLSIEENDTLPTVSRRYKGRKSIDLWLWNNRVFAVRGRAAFLAALYVLAEKIIPDTLQKVPERYLGQALALLMHKTEIVDFQTNEVWKVMRRDGKQGIVPSSFENGTGTA